MCTRPGFGPAASEKYGSSIHSHERGVRASCFDDLGIVRRSFAPMLLLTPELIIPFAIT